MHLPVDKYVTIALTLLDEMMVLSNVFLHTGKRDDFSTRNGKRQKKVTARKGYVEKIFLLMLNFQYIFVNEACLA